MGRGGFCLVLHGHLPWVLHHGWWPHGEVWLYEAVAETWLPLLDMLKRCADEGVPAPITLGLTPILLEQLAHRRLRTGFPRWLADQDGHAARDESEFTARGDGHLAFLARSWRARFAWLQERFDAIGGDLPAAFARLDRAGSIEILTSNATHALMPLVLHDRSSRAQLRVGVAASEARLGFRPRGAWLPECAYRPAGPWTPPAVHGNARARAGVEEILAHEGISHFFVDAPLFSGARSEGMIGPLGFGKVGWDQAAWDGERAWRSVLEPHLVTSRGGPGVVAALARHPEVSEQVWSGEVGYPGDGRYLEFHKKHNVDGNRYWKVTGPGCDLGLKQAYQPDEVAAALYSHAQHFCATVRSVLRRHLDKTGRAGVVVAPFDAELFGHWWHEGTGFLREVFLALKDDPIVEACTVGGFLAAHPPDKVVALPEGTWGAGGDLRVWLNDELRWTWEAAYRAEERFLGALDALPWRVDAPIREALEAGARELLLLQASDWQFIVHTRGAVDYGYRRFGEHLARFDRALTVAGARAGGVPDDDLSRLQLDEMRAHDGCFPLLDLEAWSPDA